VSEKPKLAATTFGVGSAAKQDARRKAHVKRSADKLAEVKRRAAADEEAAEERIATLVAEARRRAGL
jgi:hypothetical protein